MMSGSMWRWRLCAMRARLRKLNVNEVWRIAERRRTLTFMRPYLEAIA